MDKIESIGEWFVDELEHWAEEHAEFGKGYMLEDKLQEMAALLAIKTGKQLTSQVAVCAEETESPEWAEVAEDDTIKGTTSFMGKTILKYASGGDGYAFSVESIDKRALTEALNEFIRSQLGLS